VFTFQLSGRKRWATKPSSDTAHPWYHFSYPLAPTLCGDLADQVSSDLSTQNGPVRERGTG
jgi:hypothetical protein